MFPVQYARILLKLTEEKSGSELDTALLEYIKYLKSEHAMTKIKYIIKEYIRLAQDADGTSPIDVTTAHELTSASTKAIEQEFGGTINSVTIDSTLVGGVVVRKGNTILNASIAKQLELLANSMK